jgi:hypothetical protein
MLLQGVVISYNPQAKVKKQGGGTYDAWELVYRTPENEVKTLAKPVQGLRFNAALKNTLSSLAAGDEFTAMLEKNANGYFDVQSVEKGLKNVQETVSREAAQPDGNRQPARAGRVTGSNYETPEERAKRQVLIVRQSSIGTAVEALKLTGRVPEKIEEIFDLAKEIEKYVWKDFSKVAKKYLEVKLDSEEE